MKADKFIRCKSALARLEKQYAAFKAAGKDKAPWETTRNGKKHYHKGSSYAQECKRMETEIARLKEKIGSQIA